MDLGFLSDIVSPDAVDFLGKLRYGSGGTTGKERAAASGYLPGAPADNTADLDRANRYAAGYMFTKNHPTIAPYAIPAASFLHGIFGDDPNTQSYAQEGMNRALLDY